MASPSLAGRWRENTTRSKLHDWQNFLVAVAALGAALLLALYSSGAAEAGHSWAAGISALMALGTAGWVAVRIVPRLARRTSLRWLAYRLDYRVTRDGIIYIAGVFVVALAALNTGNNLLFMMLACMLAGILISGALSQMVLSGVELRLELPEHVFAGQPVTAVAELINHKESLPSFSLRLTGAVDKDKSRGGITREERILPSAVYFPYLPKRQTVQQRVDLVFPRRGVYRQEALGLQTKFPFGFLEKTRRVDSPMQVVVFPAVAPNAQFFDILPLVTGELESFLRGQGHDLYSIRDYQRTDSARHVDWKASAKTGLLHVREFAREDERRVLLVFDASAPVDGSSGEKQAARFERGVAMCASLAWHFHEMNSHLGFRTAGFETPVTTAGDVIYDILRQLAVVSPQSHDNGRAFLEEILGLPQTFKIIVTSQPHGSIPATLWSSSYVLFVE